MASYAVYIQDNSDLLKVQVWRTPTTLPAGASVIAQNFIQNNNAASNAAKAITSSTDATPIVLTVASGHGVVANDPVTVSGHLVNVAANGTFIAASVTATTITLQGSVGSGAGAGGATGYFRELDTTPSYQIAVQDAYRAIVNDRSANGD